MQYNDGKSQSTSSTKVSNKSVGNYFDETGVLCNDRLIDELKKIYDEARLNARKEK